MKKKIKQITFQDLYLYALERMDNYIGNSGYNPTNPKEFSGLPVDDYTDYAEIDDMLLNDFNPEDCIRLLKESGNFDKRVWNELMEPLKDSIGLAMYDYYTTNFEYEENEDEVEDDEIDEDEY